MFNPLAPLDDDKQNARDPFGRVMPKAEPDHVISNLGNPAALDQPVGEQGRNDRRDVAKVETMLGRSGALDLKKTDGPTGYWGERAREATRNFQKQNGLKVDGQINPDGETIRTLAKVAGGLVSTLAGNAGAKADTAQPTPRHPRPGSGTGSGRNSDTPDIGMRRGNDRDTRHLPYALPDDVFAENQRMADALARRKGIGDFHRFTTDAINTDGARAVYEVGDLIKQVRANDPAQADELLAKTRQGIAPANVHLLASIAADEGAGPQNEPAHRAAPVEQKPGSDDVRNPSAPKAEEGSPVLPKGISMDEHGQSYDKDGKPIANPDIDPNLQKAQLAPPLPAVAPLPGGSAPASPEEIGEALKNAGDDLDKLARDPVFLQTPLGKVMIMQGMFKGMLEGNGTSPRTDAAPRLPDREEFPAHEGDPKDGILKGRPTEPSTRRGEPAHGGRAGTA